jgi:hypothetical protein
VSRTLWIIGSGLVSIALLLGPYMLTVYSRYSLCLSPPILRSAPEKIANAIAYVDRREREESGMPYRRIKGQVCCKVDKGASDDPGLTLFHYLLDGSSHYVHVPEVEQQAKLSGPKSVRYIDTLVIVSSCAKPLYYGTHP